VATIESGWNKLVGADQEMIMDAWLHFVPPNEHPPIYGTGRAAQQIAQILKDVIAGQYERKSRLESI
jgi:hypothetical protein